VHNDLLDELSKFRSARPIFARDMERRYHPTHERALMLRTHA